MLKVKVLKGKAKDERLVHNKIKWCHNHFLRLEILYG
jgi:hypothetical protein